VEKETWREKGRERGVVILGGKEIVSPKRKRERERERERERGGKERERRERRVLTGEVGPISRGGVEGEGPGGQRCDLVRCEAGG
jgi:hypothetical protein